jgi:GMP synthase (glutamine-hydrolysing)
MIPDFYPFDRALPGRVASIIINEGCGVNRIKYHVASKPPGAIE